MDTRDLLQRIDLRALAESAGAKFAGMKNSSACPIHKGNNPTSFHIYMGSDGIPRWHCFTGCRRGGDAIGFYMAWQGVDFPTAVRELQDLAGNPPAIATTSTAPPPEQRLAPSEKWQARCQDFLRYTQDELWQNEEALSYLTQMRGLNTETIGSWGLGYNPRDVWDVEAEYSLDTGKRVWLPQGIIIPGWRHDALYYVKIRRPIGEDMIACGFIPTRPDLLPNVKYASIRGGRQVAFGETHLARRSTLVLVEGEFDAMLLHQVCGKMVDVLTLGGAAARLTTSDLMTLATYQRIIAAHDNDQAGERARALLAQVSDRITTLPPTEKDITAMWRAGGDRQLHQWLASARSATVAPAPTAQVVIERLDLNGDDGWQRINDH